MRARRLTAGLRRARSTARRRRRRWRPTRQAEGDSGRGHRTEAICRAPSASEEAWTATGLPHQATPRHHDRVPGSDRIPSTYRPTAGHLCRRTVYEPRAPSTRHVHRNPELAEAIVHYRAAPTSARANRSPTRTPPELLLRLRCTRLGATSRGGAGVCRHARPRRTQRSPCFALSMRSAQQRVVESLMRAHFAADDRAGAEKV